MSIICKETRGRAFQTESGRHRRTTQPILSPEMSGVAGGNFRESSHPRQHAVPLNAHPGAESRCGADAQSPDAVSRRSVCRGRKQPPPSMSPSAEGAVTHTSGGAPPSSHTVWPVPLSCSPAVGGGALPAQVGPALLRACGWEGPHTHIHRHHSGHTDTCTHVRAHTHTGLHVCTCTHGSPSVRQAENSLPKHLGRGIAAQEKRAGADAT